MGEDGGVSARVDGKVTWIGLEREDENKEQRIKSLGEKSFILRGRRSVGGKDRGKEEGRREKGGKNGNKKGREMVT